MLTSNVYVQSSALPAIDPKVKVTVPLAFVIQAERNADKLALLEATNASLQAQVDAFAGIEANYKKLTGELEGKVVSLEKSVSNAEAALKKAEQNVGLTEQQKQLYVDRLNEYKQELAEVRHDLDKANSAKKWYLAAGVGAGYFFGKKY